ncbi:3'-5' exonuclease [Tessaracoccus sp.]
MPTVVHPLAAPRRRIFIDLETTGLRPTHQATEVAWWDLETDDHGVFIPVHSLDGADPYALEIQGYDARIKGAPVDEGSGTDALWARFYGDGTRAGKAAIVAANPGFDGGFLSGVFDRAGLDPEPFHYRKLNVSEGAYWLYPGFGEGNTPGLNDVAAMFGVVNPNPHEAMSDVRTGVVVYRLLEQLRHAPLLAGAEVFDDVVAAELARVGQMSRGPRTGPPGTTR